MDKAMRFEILLEPIPKARARTVVKNGRVMSFTPKATSQAEAFIRSQIAESKEFYPAGVPLSVSMVFHISKPPTVPKKRLMPVTRPDLDNYCKLILDACNKYLWADDSQICHMVATKRYGQPPRIEVVIDELVSENF